MKNILVPIDFSDASFNAISYAAFLANVFGSSLLLVHVYSDTSAYEEYKKSIVFDSKEELEAANEKYLKKEIERIAKKYTVKIKAVVLKGNPANVISEEAAKRESDIIVMGMKGKGESNSIFGSTTTSIIDKTSIPLLVIPFNVGYKTIDTVTLTSDFNDQKLLSNFSILQQFISRFDPFIQILNVQKKNSDLTPKMIADKMKIGLQWDKHNYSFNIIEKDNIQEGINNFLKHHPSDLLVMIARRHNFIKKVLGISHTKKMTHQTKVPLLILHEE
jgi:nucleotide-binding universal stress UspA family protein